MYVFLYIYKMTVGHKEMFFFLFEKVDTYSPERRLSEVKVKT